MAKLILSLDNAYVSEYPLTKVRTTIGRRPTNDIHLDNLAVSGEHAIITKVGNDFYIEDLDSTNGTLVNDEIAKKHQLQHADVIEFGKFQLKYLVDGSEENTSAPAFEKTMMVHPSALRSNRPKSTTEPSSSDQTPQSNVAIAGSSIAKPVVVEPVIDPLAGMVGKIQVLNGTSSGRELVLNKAMTTLGKTGIQVAVITKRPNGYYITHVEGKVLPIVNGASAGVQAFALKDHDVIELAGVKMEFYLTKL